MYVKPTATSLTFIVKSKNCTLIMSKTWKLPKITRFVHCITLHTTEILWVGGWEGQLWRTQQKLPAPLVTFMTYTQAPAVCEKNIFNLFSFTQPVENYPYGFMVYLTAWTVLFWFYPYLSNGVYTQAYDIYFFKRPFGVRYIKNHEDGYM